MKRIATSVVFVLSIAVAPAACRGVLGIDEDRPLLQDGGGDGGGGDGSPTGDGANGTDGSGTDGANGTDGGVIAVDRRYAVWPLPDPHPLLSDYDLTSNDVVTDKTTGLVWQRQEPTPVSASISEATTYCDKLDLGGQTDWRLPTRIELLTILDYGNSPGVINKTVFPDSPQAGGTIAWTSSLSLLRATLTDHFVVDLSLAFIDIQPIDQTSNLYRCVRGGPTTSPKDRYVVSSGTARDVRTGTTWRTTALATAMKLDDAKAACAAITADGGGWRLPNVRELVTLVDEAREVAPMTPAIFDAGPKARYWSSTIRANPATAAYAVDMGTANTHQMDFSTEVMAVRCAR